jgi:hypothetical protein
MPKVQPPVGAGRSKVSRQSPDSYAESDDRVAGRADRAAVINRLPSSSFACRTDDSALGLGYSVSKGRRLERRVPQNVGAERNDNHPVAHERPLHPPLWYCPRTDGLRLGPPRDWSNWAIRSVRFRTLAVWFSRWTAARRWLRAAICRSGLRVLGVQNGRLRATAARGQGQPWISPSYKIPPSTFCGPAFGVVLGPFRSARVGFDRPGAVSRAEEKSAAGSGRF